MSITDNEDFFDEKRIWSRTKDSLLSCYLKPFLSKTLGFSRNGFVYVDGFSGKGRFGESGELGSPLIFVEKMNELYPKAHPTPPPLKVLFSETDEASLDRLKVNVASGCRCATLSRGIEYVPEGFGRAMAAASEYQRNGRPASTYFVYADPYGIKVLDLDVLTSLSRFGHSEVLVNFCSVGFIRDALAARKISRGLPEGVKIISEEFDSDTPMTERQMRLSRSIGSAEWIDLIERYGAEGHRKGSYAFWELERQITDIFCASARKSYRYVTNIPIKDMSRNVSRNGEVKFRLVHMTNHMDGCVLMNDNMLRRNDDAQVIQESLFTIDLSGTGVDEDEVDAFVRDGLSRASPGESIRMWDIESRVINRFGVFEKSPQTLRRSLSPLLAEGIIERVPVYGSDGKEMLRNSFSNPKLKVRRI